jgi:hypothetical protein
VQDRRSDRDKDAGVTAMLELLLVAYPWKEMPPPEEIRLWSQELREYEADELMASARTHVRASKRWPSIAEILENIDVARRQPPKWTAPQLPPGGLVTQDEVKSIVSDLVKRWSTPRSKADEAKQAGQDWLGQFQTREPGSDDDGTEAA